MEKKKLVWILVIIGVCFLYVFSLRVIIENELPDLHKQVEWAFLQSVDKDFEERIPDDEENIHIGKSNTQSDQISKSQNDTTTYHKKASEEDTLSFKQKVDNFLHSYLYYKNPVNVTILDSLFHSYLIDKKIKARTAVVYTDNPRQQTYKSREDVGFYKSAYATEPITSGTTQEVTVQGFVKVSRFTALFRSAAFIPLTIACLALIACFVYYAFYKKKIVNYIPVSDLQEALQNDVVQIQLVDDLYYDRHMKCLRLSSESIYNFDPTPAKVFESLLKGHGSFVSHKNLIDACWDDPASFQVKKKRLNQLILRLNKDLKKVSHINIKNIRGQGYQVFI
ncbi:winged helix-turn-helix domain-containing protein [Parabacteroides sp. PFB2-10]|uniref:winged helix-turn-helix domain-containing protein n=1 Tax=Parabacteroides sp. PFB2-10 TaxID=1742405 RepID=UPI00247418E9|nr:winged helix-turn-helix domain-containing protein [Parabacteroides sp. PFB2-10]MDL2245421.1 winged helix-turn-helix domain-containing protein [Parabacteroides sp. OttesenSCG-928-J18]